MKVVRNTCDKELDGEMKSVNENCFESSLENFQKLLPFRDIYGKYQRKTVYSVSVKSKACGTYSIHCKHLINQ